MRTAQIGAFVVISMVSLSVAGCKNPAEGKAEAKTGKAKTVKKGPLANASERAVLSPANTKLTWKGSKVNGSHTGSFSKFSGSIEGQGADATKARITVDIEVGSLTSDAKKLTVHLKSPDFFDAAKHPKAKFVSTSIKTGGDKGASHTITGNLTLKGVTKSITFPATLKITDSEVHAKAEFWIDRKKWGVSMNNVKDKFIRKEVVLKLDVKVARSKK